MTRVDFVHFYRPNGRQENEWIDLNDEVAPKVKELRAAGCRLTAEILMDGLASFCIEEPELGDFDIELVPNGPQVPVKITEMLLRFEPAKFQEWKCEMLKDEQDESSPSVTDEDETVDGPTAAEDDDILGKRHYSEH